MTPIEKSDIDAVMRTETGRKFISSILDYTGVDNDTYDPDTHAHAYKAGKRKVGLHIIEQIKTACPDMYMQLIRENDNE